MKKEHKKKRRHIDYKGKTKAPVKKGTIAACALLIVIMGFVVYSNSFRGEFIWDDDGLINNNPHIKSFSNIATIFSRPIGSGEERKVGFYRPLQMFSYMLDYSLW